MRFHPVADHLVYAYKRAAYNEQDPAGVNRCSFCHGVTAAARFHNVYLCAFNNFQQRLLHAFPAHIPGNGQVFSFAGQLVYLIDIYDARFRFGHVPVRRLQKTLDTALRVGAYVSVFRQRGRIGDGERNLQDVGQRFDQSCFSHTGRPQHQNVALFNGNLLCFILVFRFVVKHFVMVVYRNGKNLFRPLLPYDVPVQVLLDFFRVQPVPVRLLRFFRFFFRLAYNFRMLQQHADFFPAGFTDIGASAFIAHQHLYLIFFHAAKTAFVFCHAITSSFSLSCYSGYRLFIT